MIKKYHNCVSCGSPPLSKSENCAYCGRLLDFEIVEERVPVKIELDSDLSPTMKLVMDQVLANIRLQTFGKRC